MTINNGIRIKQIELFRAQLPILILTNYIALTFISYVLWNYVDHASFITWTIIFNLIMLFRISILYFGKRVEITASNLKLWDYLNFVGTLLAGLAWGSLTFFYSASWPVEIQVTFWVALVALMSGASASLMLFRFYLAYSMPIFLGSLYTQFMTDNHYMMAVYIIYVLLLSLTTIKFRKMHNLNILQQLTLTKTNEQLQALANRDALTNLPNRRAFDEYLQKEWRRHVRSKLVMSLLMIDVDYFKKYNDTYGHDKGDTCLKNLASIMNACLHRPSDIAARYGGEEFTILLPETTKAGAIEVADRLHDLLRKKSIPHESSSLNKLLTISIGIASLIPKAGDDYKIIQLIADKELYKAKANGRNCTSYGEQESD